MVARVVAGFETRDLLEVFDLTSPGGGANILTTTGPGPAGDWSQAYYGTGTSNGKGFIPGACTEVYMAFRLLFGTTPVGSVLQLRDSFATSMFTLGIDSSNRVKVTDSNSLVLTGSTVLATSAWHLIELHAKLGGAGTGIIQVRLDGYVSNEPGLDNTTTVDTQAGTGAEFAQFDFGNGIGNGFYLDDIIIYDTTGGINDTWVGDCGVYPLPPDGDAAASIQWLRDAATYSTYDTEVITNGSAPWAAFRLDETSGTVADNAEGTAARDGTYESPSSLGTTTNRTNIRAADKAVLFSGSGDVLLASGSMNLASATDTISVEAWMQMTAGGAATQCVWSGRNSASANGAIHLNITNGNRFDFFTRDSANVGSQTIQATWSSHDMRGCGHWHHVVCTRDATKTKRIYVDGVLLGGPTADTMGTGTGTMDWSYIARDRQDANFFAGYVSELNIFRGVLDATEVTVHYAASSFSFEQVDDGKDSFAPTAADDDSSYVASSTTGDRDLYTLQDLDTTLVAAGPIAIKMRVKKTDPGSRTVTPVYKTSGAEQATTAQPALTSYTWGKVVLDKDATDTLAWTGAKLTSLQVGPKAT